MQNLKWAVLERDYTTVDRLIKRGISPIKTVDDGMESPLFLAWCLQDGKMFPLLFARFLELLPRDNEQDFDKVFNLFSYDVHGFCRFIEEWETDHPLKTRVLELYDKYQTTLYLEFQLLIDSYDNKGQIKGG